MAESVLATVVEKFLEDFLNRMGEKLSKGGRLTQSEATLLLVAFTQRDISHSHARMDQLEANLHRRIDQVEENLNRRIDDLKADMNRRFEEQDKKIEDVKADMNKRFEEQDKKIEDVKGKVEELKADMNRRFEEQDKKIEDVKADTVYLKHSFDDLRDRVVSVVVEVFKKQSSGG
ncbi:MAG: hypothetical protein QW688_04225 [Thermoprotei archaeon]